MKIFINYRNDTIGISTCCLWQQRLINEMAKKLQLHKQYRFLVVRKMVKRHINVLKLQRSLLKIKTYCRLCIRCIDIFDFIGLDLLGIEKLALPFASVQKD